MAEHIKPGAVVMIPTAYSGKERAAWMDGFAKARELFEKSSFDHWFDEQEGNGPDAPSVGGKEPEAAIPEGWVFNTADFSMLAAGSGTEGSVMLKRDKAGTAAWHQLSEEQREATSLYAYGKGKTIAEAIRAAAVRIEEGAEG